jgi:SHS2 domain-containing protein
VRRKDRLFREIEHTGDAGIEVEASERAELFERAALAMGRLMVAGEGIEVVEHREVEASGADDAEKMHDLLAAALIVFLADEFIWRDVSAAESGNRVTLRLGGEHFDRRRHILLGEIKAVTYHQLSVSRTPDRRWRARVIFDV